MKTEYEINDETLAIMKLDSGYSEVYELNDHCLVSKGSNEIMEDSCNYFGSSLDGRRKGTEAMIGVNYKAPIIVEESREIIFFLTSSARENTNWICLKHISSFYREDENLILVFKNGQKITLDLSYGVLDNQILRATRLESALRGRKIAKKSVI